MTNTKTYFEELYQASQTLEEGVLDKAISIICEAVQNGRWIFICGNGGSALTASHYVTDWAKMTFMATGRRVRAISLADNYGMTTAYANDVNYKNIFDKSLENYASRGDLLILLSGSGNSKNLVEAVKKAKDLGVTTLGVVGYDGGMLKKMCDHSVHFAVDDMQLSEDLHLSFGHIVMKKLCEE